jgi:hypothetical protein
MKITKTWLEERGACEDQLELFGKLYPDGVGLTRAALIEAANAGLYVDWLEDQLDIKPILRAEYERQIAPLWAEYDRQIAPLWAEYDRQIAPLRAEYERQIAALLADALELSE